MSSAVGDIVTNAKTIIASTLPTYSQIEYEREVEKNDFHNRTERFGFIALDGAFTENKLLGFVTIDHNFQLLLTKDFVNHDDDIKQNQVTHELFENAHLCLNNLITNRLGGVLVAGISFDTPEYIETNSVCVIRLNLYVRYRYQIT